MSSSGTNETRATPHATELPAVDSRYFLAPVGGAGWLAGIWLADRFHAPLLSWLAAGMAFVIIAALLWRRGRAGLLVACLAAVALGGARQAATQMPLSTADVAYYNGARDITLRGEVAGEPILGDTSVRLRVAAHELLIDGRVQPIEGLVLVRAGRFPAIPYGATVELTGDLAAPIALGDPGYAAYLQRQGIDSVMSFPQIDVVAEGGGSPLMRLLLALKARGRAALAAALPEPHAALLTGILLGDDSGMPRALSDDFRETGMTHIIAISGFNIAIIIVLLDVVTAPLFPRRTAALLVILFIALYTVLVGAGASVVRAAVMGATYLIGFRLLGRPTMAVAGLFTAAFLMTLTRPGTLWDIGFQLSFAATLGLILYAGPWTRRLERGAAGIMEPDVRGQVVKIVAEVLVVTLAAQVFTLPLILFHFGRLSIASLPANVLILPMQPAVMASGGATLLLGLIHPALGQAAGLVAWLFLHYTISMVRLLAAIPAASVPLPLPAAGLLLLYALIAIVTIVRAGRQQDEVSPIPRARPLSRRIFMGGVAVALAAILAWAFYANRPDGRLHVAFLDVGQGDAIFIRTPNGRQLLIDGGRYPTVLLDQLGRQMPFWDRSIDVVIATHPDLDHVAGLVDVLARFDVGVLLSNGAEANGDTAYAALLDAATARGSLLHVPQPGETMLLDDGVRLEILHVGAPSGGDNRNAASIAGRVTYGDFALLLTGDAEQAAEAAMLVSGRELAALVLKAGHHGANTSSGARFLAAVAPDVVIISAGADNDYGHPHPAMLERAAAVGAAVLRTDELGTVEVVTDGRRMWWEAERVSAAVLP